MVSLKEHKAVEKKNWVLASAQLLVHYVTFCVYYASDSPLLKGGWTTNRPEFLLIMTMYDGKQQW